MMFPFAAQEYHQIVSCSEQGHKGGGAATHMVSDNQARNGDKKMKTKIEKRVKIIRRE